ncbi:MAG: 30S ribosomal protein S13 [Dehalococcoidales bacterium]|nr:30S ribosomal protein S13 [Dehalococcoidales bacterium]
MPRISGVDIPRNKHIYISLQYIYGIGPAKSKEILEKTQINPSTKADDLTEEELSRLREVIDKEYLVEGDLRKQVNMDIKRLIDVGCYRGIRHRRGLPVHGQRTKTNARTRKGKPKTVAGRGQKRGAKK